MAPLINPSRSSRPPARHSLWVFVFPFVAALLFARSGLAGDVGGWKSLGPLGARGSALAIAVDGVSGAQYVAGLNGVSKSIDGGATWIQASNGLTQRRVLALVLDPRAPSVLYAGTHGAGVFKSIDAGSSWIPLNGSPAVSQALAIAPLTPSTLYAGTDGQGIFKTTDGGATWALVSGLIVRTVSTIAIDPRASGTVYVGGRQERESLFGPLIGLAKTTDGGMTWKNVDLGPGSSSIVSVVIDPSSSSILYVTQGPPDPRGVTPTVMRSTDAGQSWLSIADSLPIFIQPWSLAVDPRSSRTVYLGANRTIFQSLNSGLTWTELTGLTAVNDVDYYSHVYAIAFDPRSSAIYAGTGGNGLFKTNDGGASWDRLSRIFSNLNITTLATDPSDPLTVYAAAKGYGGADSGIFKSVDGGLSWTERNVGISNSDLFVYTIVIDPSAPSTVYLGTSGSGIVKSSNGGLSWEEANSGIPPGEYRQYVYSLAVDPNLHLTVYAQTGTGLFRSTDGAMTWSALNAAPAQTQVIAVVPTTPSTLYTGSLGFLYKSLDGGQTWISVKTGLTGFVSTVVADPNARDTLYVTARQIYYPFPIGPPPTINGVARSDDSGASWHLVNAGLKNTSVERNAFAIDPRAPRHIFVALSDGVYASTNGGEGWFSINDGLVGTFASVSALAVDSGAASNLYAGVSFGGVFRRSAAVSIPACAATTTSLCVQGGRFQIDVRWSAAGIGTNRAGQALPLTADTGAFWFFTPNNLELVVKVVDGRPFNGHFWVFAGALSDVAYEITVTDTESGAIRSYVHAQGPPASVGDVTAF